MGRYVTAGAPHPFSPLPRTVHCISVTFIGRETAVVSVAVEIDNDASTRLHRSSLTFTAGKFRLIELLHNPPVLCMLPMYSTFTSPK